MAPATTVSGKACMVLDKALFCVASGTKDGKTVYLKVGQHGMYDWTEDFHAAIQFDIADVERRFALAQEFSWELDSKDSIAIQRVLPALRPLVL